MNGYPRAGDSHPQAIVIPGIDTIDVSDVDTNLVGHFYYAESRSVLSDIFQVIRTALPARDRFGMRPLGAYFKFKP